VQVDRLAARIVVEPDALAEQDRCDVEVDLVDEAQLEQLSGPEATGEDVRRSGRSMTLAVCDLER
jgi:hypothetical protein